MKAAVIAVALLTAASASGQTQTQMNRDAGAAFQRADAAMNREWRLTRAYMANDGRTSAALLLDSQRAWLKFRDSQCAVEGARYDGGSMQPLEIAGCKTRLTNERTAQLRALRWER